jgi:photosystem II stability/assembly factor-like uncharacterized protein
LAVGAYGLLLITSDGGDSWQDQGLTVSGTRPAKAGALLDEAAALGIDLHFNHVQATPTGQLYLAGEGGHLYRSSDDGKHWEQSPVPYSGSLFGIQPLDDRRLLAFGLRGHLFFSADQGRHWEVVETGTDATLNDAARLRDGRIALVGLAGTVLVGSDSGSRFELHAQPDRAGFSRALEAPDGALILLGAQGARRLELPPPGGPR